MIQLSEFDSAIVFGTSSSSSAPIGVAGFMQFGRVLPGVGALGVGGIFTGITADLAADINATSSAVHSLQTDISNTLKPADLTNPTKQDLVRLKIDYDVFVGQFDAWYEEGQGTFTDTWNVTAPSALASFKQQYASYRARFIALGGRPTSGLPGGPAGYGDLWWVIPILAVGAAAFLGAPMVAALR